MIYLPDADTLNYILKDKGPARSRLESAVNAGDVVILSTVVHFQVTRYLRLKQSARLLRICDHLVSDWEFAGLAKSHWNLAAKLWADRHRAGSPIADADLLIAVTARQAGAVLVTNNVRHFANLEVTIENWAV